MPQESSLASGQRFARDLRRIREARGVTIDDLHEETKIPYGLIEAFEQTALFDHPQFNRVYLRSFARTYAQVVDVSPDEAMEALEEALAGTYGGSLAATYLGEQPPAPRKAAKPEQAEAEQTKPEQTKAEQTRAEQTPPAGKPAAPAKPPEQKPPAERPPDVRKTPPEKPGAAEAGPAASDWTAQSPPAGRRTAADAAPSKSKSKSHARRGAGPDTQRWVFIALAVVILGGIAWGAVTLLGGEEEAEPVAVIPDTTAAPDTTLGAAPAAAPARPVPALGDTMSFYVVAETGPLDPIRVTVDDDLRRPYWVEQGDSMAFSATDRIVFEELLDRIRLTLEGEEYPTDRRDAQGRIVVTRDSAMAFLGSLRE